MTAIPLLLLATTLSQVPAPLLVALGAAPEEWKALAEARGWRLLPAPAGSPPDALAKRLEAAIGENLQTGAIDPTRVYLVASGPATPLAFHLRGRIPHLWAAVAALAGSPRAAIDSNRIFAANARSVPMLWAAPAREQWALDRFRSVDYPLDVKPAGQVTPAQALDFLAAHQRQAFPESIDCETGSTAFLRCHWLEIVKVDPARRNDAVPVTRVPPGSGASLDLGGFGFDLTAPGPGLQVAWLPEKYSGPLKPGDRITAVAGKSLADARAYQQFMEEVREEKPVAVTVQRGKERIRLETRTVLARREENVTVRVKAEWVPESRELLLITRGIAALRIRLPERWAPAAINWNGQEVGNALAAGCWMVEGAVSPCP